MPVGECQESFSAAHCIHNTFNCRLNSLFFSSSISCKQLINIDLHLTNQMLQSPSCVREEEELEPVKWSCSGLGHI